MKILKSILFMGIVAVLWATASIIKTNHLNELSNNGLIPYGPLPNSIDQFYSYDGLDSAFNSKLELKRANEFSKVEFENLILNSLDPNDRNNFQKYLHATLETSVDYQIDPFWIISVMMAESGFNSGAQSHRNAHGLMQIRPDTANHLYQLMNKKVNEDELNQKLYSASENIEVGIFYLKKLLHNFRMNYRLATIAYNLGPNKLKSLLGKNEISTSDFGYFLKVQKNYSRLSKNFSQELQKRSYPFEATYVVRDQGMNYEVPLLKFYSSAIPAIKSDILLSSENLVTKNSHSLAF